MTNAERVALTADAEKEEQPGVEQRSVSEQYSDTELSSKQDVIAAEVPVAFTYNGQSHAVMMASPLDLHDFAIGFSLTERIVDDPTQIQHIEINQAPQGYAVNLQIGAELIDRLDQQRRQMSGRSGCGICGISDLAAAIPKLEPLSDQAKKPSHEVIAAAIERFQQNQTLQQQCGSVHCAGLFNQHGELLLLREDIGRHNALDKLIGASLATEKNGIQPGDFLVLSSRASHELITKTVIAGVSTLVSISAATTLAIDIAKQLNLNLVGFVRGDRQMVYHQN
ncbi:MAG: formate dehydrogenase accessory sulfurtransferase FdhD [Pseudomonadota bacterium]